MEPEDVTIREHHEPLVQLDPAEFDLKPQYVKQKLTTDDRVFVRESVREKLRAAKAMLPPGWNIRIWDGWRSDSVQQALFERLSHTVRSDHPDWSQATVHAEVARFIWPPAEQTAVPPPHSTGGAVDLTLVDADGQAVDFGTPFDEFSPRAVPDYFDRHAPQTKADQEAATNRKQLFFVLLSQEFTVDPEEWWHFDYGNAHWAAAKGIEIARYGATEPVTKKLSD